MRYVCVNVGHALPPKYTRTTCARYITAAHNVASSGTRTKFSSAECLPFPVSRGTRKTLRNSGAFKLFAVDVTIPDRRRRRMEKESFRWRARPPPLTASSHQLSDLHSRKLLPSLQRVRFRFQRTLSVRSGVRLWSRQHAACTVASRPDGHVHTMHAQRRRRAPTELGQFGTSALMGYHQRADCDHHCSSFLARGFVGLYAESSARSTNARRLSRPPSFQRGRLVFSFQPAVTMKMDAG